MLLLPLIYTLFPYTTLFRSLCRLEEHEREHAPPLTIKTIEEKICLQPSRFGACARHTCQDQRSEEHTSELQSHSDLVCRLLLEKKNIARRSMRLYVSYECTA